MADYGLPALYVLLVWWFTTGVIIYLDGLPRHTYRWSMVGASVVVALSLWGLTVNKDNISTAGAYAGFTYGILVWAWVEISFLMGFLTGPRRTPCPEGCGGWRHFGHAIQAILYHELAIIGAALLMVVATWGGPNQVGTWTFMILWWMRQSAKLNVFLGVRNLSEELLPDHLRFLRSFLRKRPMNLLFPLSITVSTTITVLLALVALDPASSERHQVGFTFLATLLALGVLEHWMLMVPLPSSALWGWALKSHTRTPPVAVELVAGFFGAGKSTWLARRLRPGRPEAPTLVLTGAEVPLDHLPAHCLAIPRQDELAPQIEDLIGRWSPERIVIEADGLTTLSALRRTLELPLLTPLLGRVDACLVVDAATYSADHARMPGYFQAQAQGAGTIVVNKADLVAAATERAVALSLARLNPAARVVTASHGVLPPPDPSSPIDHPAEPQPPVAPGSDSLPPATHGFRSWSLRLPPACDRGGLAALLEAIAAGRFGEINRVRGLARTGADWIRFDLVDGAARIAPCRPEGAPHSQVVALVRAIDEAALSAAFLACAAARSCVAPATGAAPPLATT